MPLNCSTNGPLPSMHFSKQLSIDRNQNFQDNLLPALNAAMPAGKSENSLFTYRTPVFVTFLNDNINIGRSKSLTIYFACIDDRLDLIYAVDDPQNSPNGQLYFIYAQGQFIQVFKGTSTTSGTASYWVTEFVKNKVGIIRNQTLIPDPTLALSYTSTAINQFIAEINTQQPTSIKACFSLYLNNSLPTRRNRLFVNFVFGCTNIATGVEEDAYIDDCANFPGRKPATMLQNILQGAGSVEQLTQLLDFDNSTMCPPESTCFPTLP